MIKYEVGKYIENVAKRYSEGVKFDITDEGASVIAMFNSPTMKEIEEFKNGKIKLGYYVYKNTIFLLIKIGSLEWMDAPYSIHLSKYLTKLEEIKEGDGFGLALTLYLVDAKDGKLEVLRLLGANNRLSKNLIIDIKKQKEMLFENYDANINYIFKTFTTKELVNRAKILENMRVVK